MGSERCDDHNTANGDGCSSACVIQAGYSCSGGSSTQKDTCSGITCLVNNYVSGNVCTPCLTGFSIAAGGDARAAGELNWSESCLSSTLFVYTDTHSL